MQTTFNEKAATTFPVVILGAAGNPGGGVAGKLDASRWARTGSPLREDDAKPAATQCASASTTTLIPTLYRLRERGLSCALRGHKKARQKAGFFV